MYHYPGEAVTDFCIVQRHGIYHLFHIRGERWAWPLGYTTNEIDLGHAISSDMRTWTPCPWVVPPGAPGTWDDSGIWAPHILEAQGLYYMYYTGVDPQYNQAIGVATSSDLYTWTKHPNNPIVKAGPWSDRDKKEHVAGRDPMVFADSRNGRYLMYYTATLKDGRPCIALASSRDLLNWQDEGPTFIEEDPTYNRLESAFLVEHGDRYYLFYSAKGGPASKGHTFEEFAHFEIVYIVSDDPVRGWSKPRNHKLLEGWTCASEHPTFDGNTYMFYIISEAIDGIWGSSILSDPKLMMWQPDGTVQIREYVPSNVSRRPLFPSQGGIHRYLVERGGEWLDRNGVLMPPVTGDDTYFVDTRWGQDLAIEVEMCGQGETVGSLLVRTNPSVLAAYRVGLDFGRDLLGFYRLFPGRQEHVLQERQVQLDPGRWYKLKVVARGQVFEVYLDDALWMVQQDSLYNSGCFGLHACGNLTFRNLEAYEYVGPPEPTNDDWQYRCLPRYLFPDGGDARPETVSGL